MSSQPFLIAPILLLFSYIIQGYILHQTQSFFLLVGIMSTYICIQLAALVPAVRLIERKVQTWIGSDVIHLAAILTTTFFVAVVMVWIKVLENLLLIFAVELLTRLELQQSRLSHYQKLAILSGCLVFGLGLGWITYGLVDSI